MKIVYFEAFLYFTIAVCTPLGEFLTSDRPTTGRAIAAICIVCLIGGCNALKAFLSDSFSRQAGEVKHFLDDFATASATPAPDANQPQPTKPQ